MAVARIWQPRYTPEEYLAMEEHAQQRSEYFKGQIFAMAGGTYNHEMIGGNVFAALHTFAQTKGCVAFGNNMRLLVEAHNLYTYPDAMLICGKPQFPPNRKDILLNPLLLVEVLWKSTRDYDRGDKFEFYRSIPTFQHYLMVDQERVFVEYYHKVANGQWLLTEVRDAEVVLTFQAIDLRIPLRDLYHRVDWFVD